jgi:hypothetical protein
MHIVNFTKIHKCWVVTKLRKKSQQKRVTGEWRAATYSNWAGRLVGGCSYWNANLALGFHLFSKILFPTICVLLCTFNLPCLILQWKIRFVGSCKISLKVTSELVKSGCHVKASFSLIFYPKNTKLVVMRRELDYLQNNKKAPTF